MGASCRIFHSDCGISYTFSGLYCGNSRPPSLNISTSLQIFPGKYFGTAVATGIPIHGRGEESGMKKRTILYSALVTGILGFFLFFPMKLCGDCCLAEFLIHTPGPHCPLESGSHRGQHQMARHYVFPYGLLWWSSIGLLFWCRKRLTGQRVKAAPL